MQVKQIMAVMPLFAIIIASSGVVLPTLYLSGFKSFFAELLHERCVA